MEEFVYYGLLFDIYKDLLNEKEVDYFKLYYEENLTLQEIADLKSVSKSYVGNIIKKTTKKLEELENKLHIYEKKCKLEKLIEINDINKIKKGLKDIL